MLERAYFLKLDEREKGAKKNAKRKTTTMRKGGKGRCIVFLGEKKLTPGKKRKEYEGLTKTRRR